MKQIVDSGSPSTKLVLGLGTYGRTFTLVNAANHDVLAPAKEAGVAGRATKEKGFLAYYEICDMLNKGGTRVYNEDQQVPYAYWGDQWVGYDDTQSLKVKVSYRSFSYIRIVNSLHYIRLEIDILYPKDSIYICQVDFIKEMKLGGGMFWALDLDDFKGKHCGQGKYPLITFVSESLKGKSPK